MSFVLFTAARKEWEKENEGGKRFRHLGIIPLGDSSKVLQELILGTRGEPMNQSLGPWLLGKEKIREENWSENERMSESRRKKRKSQTSGASDFLGDFLVSMRLCLKDEGSSD